MKIIYLTAITTAPTEEAQKKIEEANKGKEIKNGVTPPKSWFKEQNLPIPADAPDDFEKDEFGNVLLDDEDLEEVVVAISIPIQNLDSWGATIDGDTIVYTKNGVYYLVEEKVWEIDAYVELHTMGWFRRNYLFFKSFLADFFKKKNNNNGFVQVGEE